MNTPSSTKSALVRTIVVVLLLGAMMWIAKRFLVDGGDPMPPKPAEEIVPTVPA